MLESAKVKELQKNLCILADSISKLDSNSLGMLDRSVGVNKTIRNFLIPKGIGKLIEQNSDVEYIKPLLSSKSRFLKDYLGFDMYLFLKELYNIDVVYYTLNEVYNLLNYGKTTTRIIDSNVYVNIINIFNPISKLYRNSFIIPTKILNSKTVSSKAIMSPLEEGVTYELVYIKPKVSFSNSGISNTKRTYGLPTVIGLDGLPANTLVWNDVFRTNYSAGTDIYVRCLIPVKQKIGSLDIDIDISKLGKVMSLNKNNINKYYKNNIDLLLKATHYPNSVIDCYGKMSIVILTAIESYRRNK